LGPRRGTDHERSGAGRSYRSALQTRAAGQRQCRAHRPPDKERNYGNQAEVFSQYGAAQAHDNAARHPGFHKTHSVDYAIVIEGEIWALMDVGETLMKTGDVLIQRGTNHAWANRTDRIARVLFVLNDATPV
jgi:hypothetical protein